MKLRECVLLVLALVAAGDTALAGNSSTSGTSGENVVQPSARPPNPATESQPGDWSFVVFPDTQYAVALHPNMFYAMCQWVATNKQAYHIKEAVSVGDLVDRSDPTQLTVASNGCRLILAAGIPMLLAPGNHDKDALSSINPYGITNYNRYLPQSFWTNVPGGWTGGFENPTNIAGMYNVVSNHGTGYVFLGAGWVPDTNLLSWATNVFAAYPSCPAFYTTHLFVDDVPVGRRASVNNQWAFPSVNLFEYDQAPQYLYPNQQWNNYLARTKNVVATFSGHFTSGMNQEWFCDHAADGHIVTQIFVNYQSAEVNGPNMFWELVTVSPGRNACYVQTLTQNDYSRGAVVQSNATSSFPLYGTGELPQPSAWQKSQTLSASQNGLLLYLNFEPTKGTLRDGGPFALHQTYGLGLSNSAAPFSSGIRNHSSALVSTELGTSPTFATAAHYVAIGDRDPFANLSNLTLSAWVKISSPSSISPRGGTIVADYIPPYFCDFWLYVSNTAAGALDVGFVTEDQLNHSNPHTLLAGAASLADGHWHHLAATYASGEKKIYVDAALAAAATPYRDLLFCGPGNLSIGNLASPSVSWGPTTNQLGNNYLDEVKVAGQAWTATQISQEYQRVKAVLSGSQ